MDGFNDSLSQHFSSADEMIAANGQADAEQMDELKSKVDKYEEVLDKLDATVENLDRKMSERINESVTGLNEKINEIKAPELPAPTPSLDPEEYSSKLFGVEDKLEEHIHKENVRVYRNVQAAVVDELAKQTSTLSQSTDALSGKLSSLDGKIGRLEQKTDALATMIDDKLYELGKGVNAAGNTGKGKALLSLQVIGIIAIVADLAINILKMLGML